MHKRAMVELDTAIKVSVDGKKLFDMSKDLVLVSDSLQLADNPGTDNIEQCHDNIHTFCCGVNLAQVAINCAFSSVLWTLEFVMLLQSYLGR